MVFHKLSLCERANSEFLKITILASLYTLLESDRIGSRWVKCSKLAPGHSIQCHLEAKLSLKRVIVQSEVNRQHEMLGLPPQ
jgi:hypothetical protein